MQPAIVATLSKFLDECNSIHEDWEIVRWASKVETFLQATGCQEEYKNFVSLTANSAWDLQALHIGFLEGILAMAEAMNAEETSISDSVSSHHSTQQITPSDLRKVFIVHGHDNEAKEGTARFITRLGLQPIILHEQPSSGRTVIEKFEIFTGDIAFAVVLLTPDDIGAPNKEPEPLRPRARQNVIMELGFFIGKLGRPRVCALHRGGVELPSDYQGVLYIELDEAGAWKTKLAQELVQAKLPIDLNALLGG